VDVSALKVFREVAREGSISKAAQKLSYVQSNVTARIQQMEEVLGTPLFHRHSRGITLTAAGVTMLDYADRILALFEEAVRAVQDSPVPRGPLRIGSMEETAAARLPSLLSAFHVEYPEVDIQLSTGSTQMLVRAVLEHAVESAFVDGPIEHEEIESVPFAQEELVVATSPLHPTVHGPQDLVKHTLYLLSHNYNKNHFTCVYRFKLEQWWREEGFLLQKTAEVGTLEGILGCVQAGLGYAVLPRSYVEKWSPSGELKCYPLPPRYGSTTTVFIRRKDAHLTSAMKRFLESVENYAVR
jgi:molybdate transport repressor ModE-like protein